MGKLRYFEVRFTNRSRLYHAGENVTGQVLLDLKEAMQIQGVEVSVYGKPSVRNLSRTGPGCCSTVFSEAEAITDGVVIFPYAPVLEGSDTVLENGFHTLNFSIPLPYHLPSSFESKHSKVQYYVLVEAEMGVGKVVREKVKATFKVINTLDLQTMPDLQMSVEQRAHVALSLNHLTGQVGHVDVVFRIDKGGYIPGEKVKIFGEIMNDSTMQVNKSYVELVQVISFRSNGKLKTVRSPVTGLRHHSIPAGETDIWDTDCLVVPELPPSSLNLDVGLITISYCLQLVIVPGCLYQKVKVPINVIIGTGMTPPPAYDALSHRIQGPLRVHSLPLRDLSNQQMDIINTEGGRISLALVTPPPYDPYNEPPPPYEETDSSS